jgi:U3 small nucleolar RNA-associated protein 15
VLLTWFNRLSSHELTTYNDINVYREQADGSRLISGSLDQHLKIYDVVDYSVVHTIKYNAPILCSALSVPLPPSSLLSLHRTSHSDCVCVCVCRTQPDNTHLVTGLSDGMLSIRHRPQKPSERTQALAKKDSLQGGSHRAFLRAKRFAHVRPSPPPSPIA